METAQNFNKVTEDIRKKTEGAVKDAVNTAASVVNTSAQDLEFIDVSPSQKLLLEGSLGGTGKDLDLGREIFAESTKMNTKKTDSIKKQSSPVKTKKTEIKKSA